MPILKRYAKQPWEVKDYDIDYTAWLRESTPADMLSSVTAAITCTSGTPDAALIVDSITVSPKRVKFMVSGGTAGNVYKLTARATTSGLDGFVRKDESELQFTITDT